MKRLITILFITSLFQNAYAARLMIESSSVVATVFFSDEDNVGTRAAIKGVVMNIGTREFSTAKEKEIGGKIQDKTKISVRLIDSVNIIPGSLLYVINERNIVVGKMSVLGISRSASFGQICVGYGSFRAAKRDYRVVQKALDSRQSESNLYIARAYRSIEEKDIAGAIENFEKAVAVDRDNPEAHIGLGYLYLDQKMIPFAMKEFDAAYKSKGRISDNEDKHSLVSGCAKIRYTAAFNYGLPKGDRTREKYLDEGIRFASEAVALNPEYAETRLILGKLYYDKSTDALRKIDTEYDDKARDEFLNVLDIQKDNIEACILIAKIYKKHSKKEKAAEYAEMARRIDPANVDARDLEKAVRNMK